MSPNITGLVTLFASQGHGKTSRAIKQWRQPYITTHFLLKMHPSECISKPAQNTVWIMFWLTLSFKQRRPTYVTLNCLLKMRASKCVSKSTGGKITLRIMLNVLVNTLSALNLPKFNLWRCRKLLVIAIQYICSWFRLQDFVAEK